MSYLTSLPLNVLKIDHQFIQGIKDNPANRKVVKAITALGDSMDLRVVVRAWRSKKILLYCGISVVT